MKISVFVSTPVARRYRPIVTGIAALKRIAAKPTKRSNGAALLQGALPPIGASTTSAATRNKSVVRGEAGFQSHMNDIVSRWASSDPQIDIEPGVIAAWVTVAEMTKCTAAGPDTGTLRAKKSINGAMA